MAIRFKLHGIDFETDSAKEARELVDSLPSPSGRSSRTITNPPQEEDEEGTDGQAVELGTNAKEMIRLLLPLEQAHGMTTTSVAEKINVNGPKGLAAVTRQIRAWALQLWNLDRDCVERFYDSSIGESAIMLSEELKKRIKGHEAEYLD